MRGLYVHIPFCKKICTYCDFTKRVPKNKEMIDNYLFILKKELLTYELYFDSVNTIYIGGGTPTILDEEELDLLLSYFDNFKNIIEYTIEINPETLTKNKAQILKNHNINRVSLGVETFDENLLKIIGRSHSEKDIYNAISILKNVGFNNINIDLMFATPGSSISSIKNDLEKFYKLDIKHVSYYSLIPEEKTILDYQLKHNKITLISNDLEAEMYEYIIDNLEKNGFKQYEISNFAKDDYESVHNKIYWQNMEYIGIGLGASGYLDGIRYTNNHLLKEYEKAFIETKEIIDFNEKLKEELILGLRLLKGINIIDINKKYNINLLEKYNEINKYISNGYMEISNGYLKITRKGLLIANDIFLIFI